MSKPEEQEEQQQQQQQQKQRPQQLYKPHFDVNFEDPSTFIVESQDHRGRRKRRQNVGVETHETESWIFHSNLYSSMPPFLTGPVAITEASLLSWLISPLRTKNPSNGGVSGSEVEEEGEYTLNEKADESPKNTTLQQRNEIRSSYLRRRAELRSLASKFETGGARIDEDGRLVPVLPPNQQQQQQQQQQPGAPPGAAFHGQADAVGLMGGNLPPVGPIPPPQANPLDFAVDPGGQAGQNDEEEERRRILQREEREATEAISRALQRYRANGVPEEELEFIQLPLAANNGENVNLTFRRIFIAVVAVVTAFVCIMIQTLPLFDNPVPNDPTFDKLLYELLYVRHLDDHVQHCPKLNRNRLDSKLLHWASIDHFPLWSWFSSMKPDSEEFDCSDGVLHVPSKRVLSQRASRRKKRTKWVDDYRNGMNVSWFFPCKLPAGLENPTPSETKFVNAEDDVQDGKMPMCVSSWPSFSSYPHSTPSELSREGEQSDGVVGMVNNKDGKTTTPTNGSYSLLPRSQHDVTSKNEDDDDQHHHKCFRGVHDGLINLGDIHNILRLASDLIRSGGDHIEIRRDVAAFVTQVPSIHRKLKFLLCDIYGVSFAVYPVAFRISVALPMETTGLREWFQHPPDQWASLLSKTVNKTAYLDWYEANIRHHSRPLFNIPLPPPIVPRPFRDPCIVMSDLEADPSFMYHTSVFLSGGAGEDHAGGTALYLDNHQSNSNPRRKVRRGTVIDGSRGRVIVSTGGEENKRCRMPTRSGIRAVLQVWWGYS